MSLNNVSRSSLQDAVHARQASALDSRCQLQDNNFNHEPIEEVPFSDELSVSSTCSDHNIESHLVLESTAGRGGFGTALRASCSLNGPVVVKAVNALDVRPSSLTISTH